MSGKADTSRKADIGLIGLAVMGQNLVLNMNDRGYSVAVHNRTVSKMTDFLQGPAADRSILGAETLEELVEHLSSPRKIMIMVKAGETVDTYIERLLPLLEKGDIIIDGGNSHYPDTERRTTLLESKGLFYIGTGVSGGEEGARRGPSIMPGGSSQAWPAVKTLFQKIAAKAADGTPCCDWVGTGGSGHYVKMVHNAIEYGDMQLISEAYHIMKNLLGMSCDEMARCFDSWNRGRLESYLIEITAAILRTRDEDGSPLVEKILDAAGQKGTGKWTVVDAAHLGVPVTLIAEAVFARSLSARTDERQRAAAILGDTAPALPDLNDSEKARILEDLEAAVYAAKITSYAQGFMLIREAAREYSWEIDYGAVAGMWRGGCIIRSAFLEDITAAFAENRELENLLQAPFFSGIMAETLPSWRRTALRAIEAGLPIPALSSALSFFEGYRSERLPANLLQAQRDYFGAHTYERVDRPRGEVFHTNWTGTGGDVASGTYNA
ncbi:6-phosphogluconate dehydrogenase (decarboxylating) [Alkalispirochaeta americana]|uniref:6-phosphogluconate dehydrogenase, decarboxylating n=1 Tax=Alkalispirochaeta americana TaxID=159291 RepID=A0A1N6UVU1_9SPIO|nr:6-phosphogluconate dehydrogenase (decarboxylating) [Alkalispirochaeta americana]